MKPTTCEHEAAVLEAFRSAAWSRRLRRHVEGCRSCSDLLLVDSFLQQEAAAARRAATVPDPDVLWWQARLAGRRYAAERATRPIAWLERAALALGVAATMAVTAWSWPVLHEWIRHLGSAWRQIPDLAATFQASSPRVLATVAALLLILFGLYWEWVED